MTSPICTVNGSTTGNGVNVASNSVVTIAIADTAGVNVWSLRCLSTDELLVASNITASLSINSITKVATFTSPTTTSGAAMIFESKVNGGLDINGRVDDSLTTRFGVFVLTDNGSLRVGAFDETTEGSAAFGWLAKFNAGIRTAADSALTPTVTGTLPIVVSGPSTARVVAINAATTSLPGSMSAADKLKLDIAQPDATANRLVLRNGSGGADFTTLRTSDITTVSGNLTIGADGFAAMTLDGASTGLLLVPGGIKTSLVYLYADVAGVVRSLPLNWTAQWVATVPGWVATPTGTAKQNVVDWLAECYVQINLPHGVQVTNMYVKTKGDGVGPVPGNLPSYYFIRQHLGTLNQNIIGFTVDAGGATYRSTSHYTTIACTNPATNIVDRATYRYYLMVTPEYGADSVVGLQLDSVSVELTFPENFDLMLGLG